MSVLLLAVVLLFAVLACAWLLLAIKARRRPNRPPAAAPGRRGEPTETAEDNRP